MTRLSNYSLDGYGFGSSRDSDEFIVDNCIQDVWTLKQWHDWYCVVFGTKIIPQHTKGYTAEEWYEWYSQWSDAEWYSWCHEKRKA